MRRISIPPVVLAAGASGAVFVASSILILATPGHGPVHPLAGHWLRLLGVEVACGFSLFFIHKKVPRANWLWIIWLVAAVDYTRRDAAALERSAYSSVVIAIYIAWAVKAVVAGMLFVPQIAVAPQPLGR